MKVPHCIPSAADKAKVSAAQCWRCVVTGDYTKVS